MGTRCYYYIAVRGRDGERRTFRVTATSDLSALRNLAQVMKDEAPDFEVASLSLGEPIPKSRHEREKRLRASEAQKKRHARERAEKIMTYRGLERID